MDPAGRRLSSAAMEGRPPRLPLRFRRTMARRPVLFPNQPDHPRRQVFFTPKRLAFANYRRGRDPEEERGWVYPEVSIS